MGSIRQWLAGIGLEQYAEAFEREQINPDSARYLTEANLKDLGLPMGPRASFVAALEALALSARASSASPPSGIAAQSPVDAERRQLTVMFCDLVGSTALAQKLDPEQLRELMRAYQQACGHVIERYAGHVAQYLGDGLMAYFGWPKAHEDDAERAVWASLEIIAAVKKVAASEPLAVRIGIATGAVVVGGTGAGDASVPKLAVGETPNIAARLQGFAGADQIVIAPSTHHLLASTFEYEDLGERTLKGILEPVRSWRVLGQSGAEGRFEAAHGQAGLTPLVGREEELQLLLRRWELAKKGEGQVVLLSGEPGIGKSRITRALRERIAEEPHIRLRYQCSPFHVNSALYPVIEHLERAADFAREDSVERKLDKLESLLRKGGADIAVSAPLIASLLSLPAQRYPALTYSPQKRKDKTLEMLTEQIVGLARAQPVLMIFEDAHWIDPTTQESLDLTVSRISNARVLMVLTYRPEYTSRWSGQAHVTTLTLNRLSKRMGTELVEDVTGGKTMPAEVLEQILAKTDGVPLFIEELTKAVLELGLLHDKGDHYELIGPFATLAIPTTLRDSLMARLDRLAPVKEIAQIGACIGREFSYELLAAVSPLEEQQLNHALDRLIESELMFRRGAGTEATYTFKHALVQDAAYDSLLKARRTQIHARIAETLEAQFPDVISAQPELVAHHYTDAGLAQKAIPYWHKAGQLALQRVAIRGAITHLDRGMSLLQLAPESLGRDAHELDLCTTLGMAWLAYKGWAHPNVASNLERAWGLERALNRSDHMLPILYGLSLYWACRGHMRDSLPWAELLLNEGEQKDLDDLRLAGHTAMLLNSYFVGDFTQVIRHADAIVASYDPERHRHIVDIVTVDPKTYALIFAAFAQWALGYPERAVQMVEDGIRHSRARGHFFDLAWTLQFVAKHLDIYRRQPEACAARLDEFERIVHEQKIDFFEKIVGPICRAAWLLISDRPQEAEAMFCESIPRWTEVGLAGDVPLYKTLHAQSAALSGQLDRALKVVDEAIEQIERTGWEEKHIYAEALRVKGWILQLNGDLAGAETAFCASLDAAQRQQAKSWELRAAISYAGMLKDQGRRREALDLLNPIYGWFTEGRSTRDHIEAAALLAALR